MSDTGAEPPPVSEAVLAGPECPTLGEVHVRTVPGAAIAMSAGRLPKGTPSAEANEDAALVVRGPRGILAAVVDGHLGYATAGAAVTAIRTAAPPLVENGWGIPQQALQLLFGQIARAATEAMGADEAPSGAAVSIALIDVEAVHVATIGDTVAVLTGTIGGSRSKTFRRVKQFVRPGVTYEAKVHRRRWRSGDRLILASDGLVDFTTPRALRALTNQPGEPRQIAEALVAAALDGGAGDNVTVVAVHPDEL